MDLVSRNGAVKAGARGAECTKFRAAVKDAGGAPSGPGNG